MESGGTRVDHFRCSSCGVDFGDLGSFDEHRAQRKIKRSHTEQECQKLLDGGQHPPGDCFVASGHCTDPLEMPLIQVRECWWTPEGARRCDKMAAMRAARTANDG